VAEWAPPRVRGALLVGYQVATVLGIIAGYLAAYALAGTENWRWMLGLAAVPAALIFIIVVRLPDTARWYVLKGRFDDARRTLSRVERGADSEAIDAEIAEMRKALAEERSGAVKEMLRKPYVRATVFVVGLGFFIQITGINAIVYYSPTIIQEVGVEIIRASK
jgi:MFS family permease